MAIVSSVFVVGQPQVDGRCYVREVHVDNAGLEHSFEYLAAVNADYNAIMLARVPLIDEQLKAAEVEACIASDRLTTVYITKSDLAARVRELYRNGEREALVRIARWIRRRIIAGDFTETQVRNAFGLTVAQWDTLKQKMLAMDDALATVENARGE